MKEVFRSLIDVSDKIWVLQMGVLRTLNLETFFVKKGWPFVVLFFVYGVVFAPLAMLYFVVGLTSAERYFAGIKQTEIDQIYDKSSNDEGT